MTRFIDFVAKLVIMDFALTWSVCQWLKRKTLA